MEGHLSYADVRPYTVPTALGRLTGPASGVVRLARRLDWSPKHEYDLERDEDLRLLYETVIREAMNPEDLGRYLNATVLLRVWTRLWLPSQVRQLWEARFPELTAACVALMNGSPARQVGADRSHRA